MKNLEKLLENYWILKDDDKETYYSIKDSLPEYMDFLNEKLGYHVIMNPNMIKLEKLPGKAESWMGIHAFDSTMEYAFLCLVLMFLEDMEREDQFVLSHITEFIQANYPGEEKVDWTLFKHRRSLIKTLRFAANIGLIKVNDGDEQGFANDETTEILYENGGSSRYFVRNFTSSILDYSSYKDLENNDLEDINLDRGVFRRHRVYRRLLMSPVVYNEGLDDSDYAYIKNFRNVIENDFEKHLGLPLHVHRNGAMVVLPETHSFRDVFPGSKAISDIVLQMNMLIRKSIENLDIVLDKNDVSTISKVYFETLAARLKEENSLGWSKEYREMTIDRLVVDILDYMEDFNMVSIINEGKEIKVLPLTGKIVGTYARDFKEKIGVNNLEQ
ncbi:TIGR02678 family protein [Tissierella creatinini]|nr:TIGR02678 family protein [Tissierella creatinini]TJX63106.1 TIGR02678 family protein [Soehngenia saccharolytica]